MARFRLAILASGSGSNAQKIIDYQLKTNCHFEVCLIGSNKNDSFVLNRAKKNNIPSFVFSKSQMNNEDFIHHFKTIDFIVLAGFLLKIPSALIQAFPNSIFNIHPSLLPKYGGKGMYGHHVHNAVKNNHEKASGMTIHLVNEKYDDGKVLFQAFTPLTSHDSVDEIASKVLVLEHAYYPQIINEYLCNL